MKNAITRLNGRMPRCWRTGKASSNLPMTTGSASRVPASRSSNASPCLACRGPATRSAPPDPVLQGPVSHSVRPALACRGRVSHSSNGFPNLVRRGRVSRSSRAFPSPVFRDLANPYREQAEPTCRFRFSVTVIRILDGMWHIGGHCPEYVFQSSPRRT